MLLILNSYPPAIQSIWCGIQLWRLGRVTWPLCLANMVGKGHLFQVSFHLMTWSTMNLWWVLNLVITVWLLSIRLMNLIVPCWWSILLSNHTLPWVHKQGVNINPYPTWTPGCDAYSFLSQAGADIEDGLDSILTDFIKTPELDVSLHKPDAIHLQSLLSSCVWLVLILIILNCSLLLASNFINYGGRLGHHFCVYHWWAKC